MHEPSPFLSLTGIIGKVYQHGSCPSSTEFAGRVMITVSRPEVLGSIPVRIPGRFGRIQQVKLGHLRERFQEAVHVLD